jgi:hypothetical protein
MEARICHLSRDLGGPASCTGTTCAFWDDDSCVIERLGLHTLHDADVSEFLVQIRTQLEAVRDATASRGEFARRLGNDG